MTIAIDTTTWVTTLIQVGVPSLVALASLLVNFFLGRASHQKDIAIANLTAELEKRKITSERKASLITEITMVLAELESAYGTYSGLFRKAKIEDVSAPIAPSQELQDAFDALSLAINKCCSARTATYLLGDKSVSHLFELYLQENFGFQRQANPIKGTSQIDLSDLFEKLSSRRNQLLGLLSDLFLEKTS